MSRTLHIDIELLADVIQTAVPATEGAHTSLPCIRGSSLLGAVATRCYDSLSPDEAWTMFHSGRVRFGDAHPLVEGEPALPAPLSWYRPKAASADPASIQNVPGGQGQGEWKQVREGWFTEGRRLWYLQEQNIRLKTAIDRTRGGRAKDSMLFGYESLPARTMWRARIELDADVPVAFAERLQKELDGQEIWLGRSRSAEYGRARAKIVTDGSAAPAEGAGPSEGLVFVHCVSDLVLPDAETGDPSLVVTAAAMQLPADWVYEPVHSDVRTFRYSPFHGKRQRRDAERVGFCRGSVMAFRVPGTPDLPAVRQGVAAGLGLCRVEGFGQVRIQPNYLLGAPGLKQAPRAKRTVGTQPAGDLAKWMSRTRERLDKEVQWLASAESESKSLHDMWRRAGRDKLRRPSVTQWLRVAGIAGVAYRRRRSGEDLSQDLEQIWGPMAGVAANDWKQKVGNKSFQDAVKELVRKSDGVPVTHLAMKLVSRKIQQARAEEDKR